MKTAVITGASRGIGRACAYVFAQNGYNVVIGYNSSDDNAKALEKELMNNECSVISVKADVSKSEEVKGLFKIVYETFGSIDVLVNNAGIAMQKLLTDTTDDDFQHINEVNYGGIFKCCREAVPYMLKNHSGSIINVSSVWGISGASCESIYSSSKSAVVGLTKALAKELGPSGIRVNCVAPGVIDTDMNSMLSDDVISELAEQTSLCRIGKPEEVAESIYFLASGKASFITGQTLTVDGGFII